MVSKKDYGVNKGDIVIEIEVAAKDNWRNVENNFIKILQDLVARNIIITYSVTNRVAEDGEILGPEFYYPRGAKKKA